jgi:hypothetical protein
LVDGVADEQVGQPVDAGGDGLPRALLGDGVRDREDAAGMRGVDQRPHCGEVERAALALVVDDLDVVGAVAKAGVHPCVRGVWAVHGRQRLPGQLLQHAFGRGGAGAGGAQRGQVGRIGLADPQHASERFASAEHVQRRGDARFGELPQCRLGVGGQVQVRVEQAGQQSPTPPVHVGWCRNRLGHLGDDAVVDHDVLVGQDAFAVEDPHAADLHPTTCLIARRSTSASGMVASESSQ